MRLGLQQHLPLAVLKLTVDIMCPPFLVATTPTARGIETNGDNLSCFDINYMLQQHLPLAVCAEGCETAEEQSDDEVRTSQVPERSEGKTKAISNSTYRLRY